MAIDFTPVIDARISDGHFAELIRDAGRAAPSRMSVYAWMRGINIPSGEYEDIVSPFVEAINDALSEGDLPLPIKTKRVEKYKALQDVVYPRLGIHI
jgi:hypothetical protein